VRVGRLPLAELVTDRVPLERIVEGFEVMAAKDCLKVLVETRGAEASR
jgi:Zn-dependent alcohol dehydrogenase